MNTSHGLLYHTLAYFDLFDFAPTALELERWMVDIGGNTDDDTTQLSAMIAALEEDERVIQVDAYYMLAGREELAAMRQDKYNCTDEKWKRARPFLRLLSAMPGVEAIWFGNSVAWCNARAESDIDLVIVALPGRIWTARFWTTLAMRLLRQRPYEQEHSRALCLSFYMTSDALNMEEYALRSEDGAVADVHFQYWVTQMYPLYDPQDVWSRFQRENEWAVDGMAAHHWLSPIPRRQVRPCRVVELLRPLLALVPERALEWLQRRIMPAQLRDCSNPNVVLSNTILKLHTNDNRATIHRKWKERTTH